MREHPFDALERELSAAAARQVQPASAAAPRRRWRRPIAGGLGIAIGVSAAAWAATSLLSSGDPVPYRYGVPPAPDRHYGTTVPGTVRMLADDVPDPSGGLPWGLRTFKTSRGYGCIQIGRVQEGKLGVLALERRGGGLTGRGLFHELRPAVLRQATHCMPLDGAGHAFLAVRVLTTSDGTTPECRYRPGGSGEQLCRGHGVRAIDAGLLGPRAQSLTYRQGTATRTIPTRGEEGGYLVVTKTSAPIPYLAPAALTPASKTITRVSYRDAPACVVRLSFSARGSCPKPPGFTPIPQPAARDVRAPIRAFAAPDRRGIRLRFRAPLAVTDGRSVYAVSIRFPGRRGGYGTPLDRNIAAGELVRTTIDLPNIGKDHRPALRPGTYEITVSYRIQPRYPNPIGGPTYPGYTVGRTRVVVG